MSITYSIAGVPLDDPAGRWKLLSDTLVGSGLSVRAVDQQIPGVDGVVPPVQEQMDAPSLVLQVRIYGSSYAELLANYGALLAVLAPTADVTVTRTVDGVSRTAVGRGKSVTDPDFVPGSRMVTVTATLRLPGVYWRADALLWSKSAPASGTAYEVTTLANGSAPVDDALILIVGPASSPKVSCGASWAMLNLTLADGEKALIDCRAWTVRRGTGVTLDGGGTLTSGSLITSGSPYLLRLAPAMVGVDPAVTATKVTLTATGMTSSSAIAVRAQPAFLV
jgi:hypothetical protein